MQFSILPNDIPPQLLHLLICDLNEKKPINNKSSINRGIRITSSKTLLKKLMKKLIPKIGITKSIKSEKLSKFLLSFRK